MKTFLYITGSIVLFLGISFTGSYDYRIESIISDIIYSLILINLKEEQRTKNYIILLAPIVLIEGTVRCLNFEDTFFSLPPFIFKLIPFTLFLIIKHGIKKKIAFIIVFIFTIIFNIFFYDYWLNYSSHGTFTGEIQNDNVYNFKLINPDKENDFLEINQSSGIIVVDFWTESCGICYKKFPQLKKLKQLYKLNKEIKFITGLNSKNINYKSIADEIDNLYNFKTYKTNDSICNKLNIDGYPTIIVFKNDKIIFRGSVELLKDFLVSKDFQKELQD